MARTIRLMQFLTGAPDQTVTIPADFGGGFTFDVRGAQGGPGTAAAQGGLAGQGGMGGRVTGGWGASIGDVYHCIVGGANGQGRHAGGAGGAGGTGSAGGGSGGNGGPGGGSSALLWGAVLATAGLIVEVPGGGGGGGGALTLNTGGYGGWGGWGPAAGNPGYNAYLGTNFGGGGAQAGPTSDGAAGTAGPVGGNPGAPGASGVGGAGGAGTASATAGGGGGGGGGGGAWAGGGGGSGGASGAGGGGGGGVNILATQIVGPAAQNNQEGGNGQIYVSWLTLPVVTPTAPTGTNSASSNPTVTWGYTNSQSQAEQDHRVVVFFQPSGGWPAGLDGTGHYSGDGGVGLTPLWDSGVVYFQPAGSMQIGIPLGNGNFRAYVQVHDVGPYSMRSAWAFTGWTQAVAGPGAPTVTVAADVANARTTVTMTAGATPTTSYFHVQRSLDGTTWADISGGLQVLNTGGPISFVDRGAPRETTIYYRVQGIHVVAGTQVLGGTWSATASTYLASDGNEWLMSSVDLTGASDLKMAGRDQTLPVVRQGPDLGSIAHEDQAQYWPEGSPFPTVISGGVIHADQFVYGIGSTRLYFAFKTDAAWKAWVALRQTRAPILLKSIYGDRTATGLEQYWIRLGTDAATMRTGGPYILDLAGQIRLLQIEAAVVAEPVS